MDINALSKMQHATMPLSPGSLSVLLLLVTLAGVVLLAAKVRLHPALALGTGVLVFGIATAPLSGGFSDVPQRIIDGSGEVLGKIAIIIACGSIIGGYMLKSGAAVTVAQAVLASRLGRSRPNLATALVGWIVSTSVFCDSGFVMLTPVLRQISRESRQPDAAPGTSLAFGLLSSHAMLIPAAGPMAAAAVFHIGGKGMLFAMALGAVASLMTVVIGSAWGTRWGTRVSGREPESPEIGAAEDSAAGPPLWRSIAPIALPVSVLVLANGLSAVAAAAGIPLPRAAGSVTAMLGAPVVALPIGVLAAIVLLRPAGVASREVVESSLARCGQILVLIGLAGAFGGLIDSSPIVPFLAAKITELPHVSTAIGCLLVFAISGIFMAALGSSTSALILTATITAPMLSSLNLGDGVFGPALALVSAGAGSIALVHVNDSYFWIVSQACRIDPRRAYRVITLGSVLCSAGSIGALIVFSSFA